MKQDKPKVSIVVLIYNQEHTLARTLDHILGQRVSFEYEIIIGEDCSSDSSRTICEHYVARYHDRIRILPKAVNKGVLINYRDCLAECNGEYIAVCAGDDWWHNPDKLQIQVEFMDVNPQCALVFTNYDIFHAAQNRYTYSVLRQESFNTPDIIDKLLKGFFLPTLTIMYRRELLQYINLDEYQKRGYRAEDLPMFLEFALHGTFHCIDVSTATYSASVGSISHFDDAVKMECFLLNMRNIKLDFLRQNPFVSQVTENEIIREYDRILFNGAFALEDKDICLKYYKKLDHKGIKEYLKLILIKNKILYSAILKMKR